MDYPKRLGLSKLMVIAAYLCLLASSDAFRGYDYSSVLFVTITALCLILSQLLLWSRLHGTGRSVRMAAYMGLILTVAPNIAAQISTHIGQKVDKLDIWNHYSFVGVGMAFSIFTIAILISIRRDGAAASNP